MKHPKKNALVFIFIISLLVTLLSLYYSYYGDIFVNIMSGDFFNPLNALTPCALCWYQRIALYPIAFLTWLALLKKDYNIVYYITPMAIIGGLIALYQYGLEQNRTPDTGICGTNPIVSCDGIQVEYFGFITLPLMSFITFLVIIIIAYNIIWYQRKNK